MSEFVRDAAATAAILGFFASSWFGWAQEAPPSSWKRWLITGSIAAGLTAVAGGLLTWANWDTGTALDETTSRTFGIVVGIEVALAGLGSWLLIARDRRSLVAPWIALVVGVHFFPLAVLLDIPVLHILAALLTIGAIVSVRIARTRDLATSAVTGVISGSVLLATALFSLVTIPLI